MANPTVDEAKWAEDDGNLSFEIISDAITLWLDCYDVSPADVFSLIDKLLAHVDKSHRSQNVKWTRSALAVALRLAAKSFQNTNSPRAASASLYYSLLRQQNEVKTDE